MGDGIYGMSAGDFNADGNIKFNDKVNSWEFFSGAFGYIQSDRDLDGQADNKDKNDTWLHNLGQIIHIPE